MTSLPIMFVGCINSYKKSKEGKMVLRVRREEKLGSSGFVSGICLIRSSPQGPVGDITNFCVLSPSRYQHHRGDSCDVALFAGEALACLTRSALELRVSCDL